MAKFKVNEDVELNGVQHAAGSEVETEETQEVSEAVAAGKLEAVVEDADEESGDEGAES